MKPRFQSPLSPGVERIAFQPRVLVSWLGISILLPAALWANPTGGNVAAGSAQISGQGTSAVLINQASNIAIINWQGFSINSGESTSFLQPGANSAALNRVLGGQTSLINGTLSANGQIYLINGNGVIVGPGGVINAGAFTASTRDITDADFLSGNLHFTGSSDAGVQNFGTINALGGNVVLMGKTVDNEGTINAPKGTAGLIAGDDVLLAQKNEDGSTSTVSPSATASVASGKVGVSNKGAITAAAAELKAANGNIYALAVQNQGTIRATTVNHQGGHIWLTSDSGKVSNSGKLDASATAAGGHGGTVILKSISGTVSHTGEIIAQGGDGGAGGNAEISGAKMQFSGTVDLTAPHGIMGTLLLDPTDVDIVAGGGTDVTASTVDPSAIVLALNSSDITITASNSITVDDLLNSSGNANPAHLTLDAPILNLNAQIQLNGTLDGTATTVNLGPAAFLQNGIDAAASGGTVNLTGGALYAFANEVVVNKNLDIEGNGATLSGSGGTRDMEIDGGNVTINNLVFTGGNGVSSLGAAGASWNGDGGALLVYSQGSVVQVAINNSTFVGNNASAGGAVYSVNISGGGNSVFLENDTLTANSATLGSVLYNYASFGGDAGFALKEDTIAGNSGSGAIYTTVLSSGSAQIVINESILAGNMNGGSESDYVDGGGGSLVDIGHNLYGQNGDPGGFVPQGAGDIQLLGGLPSVVGPLGLFGGLTPTMPLVAGSPALESGDPAYANSPDQRGVTRAVTTSFTGATPDIGAYEAQYVSVQADPITVIYGDVPNLTYSVTSGPATAAASLIGSPALVGPATNVGFYGDDIGQGTITAGPLYIVSFTNGNLTVDPRLVTVFADSVSKTYGSPDPVLTYTAPGLINGDTLSGALSYFGQGSASNVGSYPITLGTLSNSNYVVSLFDNNPTFSITPATLTYLADPAIAPLGGPFPTFTGSVIGFAPGDTQANATTGTLIFSTTAAPTDPAGSYPINGSGLTANFGNYIFQNPAVNTVALTIGMQSPGVTPNSPATVAQSASQPNTPVGQALAQTTPNTTTTTDGSLPGGTDSTPIAVAPLAANVSVYSISPNEFIDSSSGSISSSGNSDTGNLAQGSSYDTSIGDVSVVPVSETVVGSQGSSAGAGNQASGGTGADAPNPGGTGNPNGPGETGPVTEVAPGQTITLSGGKSAGSPPPAPVQTAIDQGFSPQSEATLTSAASAGVATANPGGTANPNGPGATGPVTEVAPGQTVTLAGGKSAGGPPPAPVQTAIDQGFSPQSEATLTSAANAGSASATPSGANSNTTGPVTEVAPGQTVTLSGGTSANIPAPAPVQAAFDQAFSQESHDTLAQAMRH